VDCPHTSPTLSPATSRHRAQMLRGYTFGRSRRSVTAADVRVRSERVAHVALAAGCEQLTAGVAVTGAAGAPLGRRPIAPGPTGVA
jgi:hypothetical protein